MDSYNFDILLLLRILLELKCWDIAQNIDYSNSSS